MKLLYYLIEIPLIAIAIWLVFNTHTESNSFNFELWPLENEIQVNTKLALCALVLFGYIWAKINSWFAYAPIRKALRKQKKANVVLNKEQEKLNATVSGLQKNIVGLQEKAKQQEAEYAKNNPKPTLRQRISAFWAKLFAGKKE